MSVLKSIQYIIYVYPPPALCWIGLSWPGLDWIYNRIEYIPIWLGMAKEIVPSN